MRTRLTSWWRMLAAGALILCSASAAEAAFIAGYGFDNALADQTIGFSGSPTGTSIVGNTNPPPVYNVTVSSLDGTILQGNGGHVGNSTKKDGLLAVAFVPVASIQWNYFDFQLDSLEINLPLGTPGLTINLYKDGNLELSQALNFPHEGNQGENQHYFAKTTGGDYFNRVEIVYAPPAAYSSNRIHEIHNIDVGTESGRPQVPEPASMLVWSLVAGAAGFARWRRAQRAQSRIG